MRIAILDDWANSVRGLRCFDKLAGHEVSVWTDHVVDRDKLSQRLDGVEALVLIRERTRIGSDLIASLPALRLINLWGPWSHIDLEACRRAGVRVASATGGAAPSFATAELTWALILSAARRLPEQMASLRAGHWQSGIGQTLRGRRLGILGFGKIGQLVASYGVSFGMSISVWGSPDSQRRARAAGYTIPQARDDFFAGCDVVSLHLRLAPETERSVTAADLATMQPHGILVNTSRAQLIEQGSLLAALELGRPGMAAIDVFEHEPVNPDTDPLLAHPRVIATPHLGYATLDEFELRFATLFDQLLAFARGHPIDFVT